MRGELYRRWLADDRGLTLGEFVAERRAEGRQARAQRRFYREVAPLMQQAKPEPDVMLQQLAGMQGVSPATGMYRCFPIGGALGAIFKGR